MEKLKDLGMIYSNEHSKQKRRHGLYRCFCGKEFVTQSYNISSGKTKSCGCLHAKAIIEANTKHGLSKEKLYGVYKKMIYRTENTEDKFYCNYGERGIKVCNEWKIDFMAFYNWAIANGYKEGLTIDRIDNDGNYEPSNCRWATRTLQQCNTRDSHSNNKSGYKGICWSNERKKWCVQIGYMGKVIPLGRYSNISDAIKARNEYIISNNMPHKLIKE